MAFFEPSASSGDNIKKGTFPLVARYASATINCGFRPSLVMVYKQGELTPAINNLCVINHGGTKEFCMYGATHINEDDYYPMTFTDTGFTFEQDITDNLAGVTVNYIAVE